MKENWKPLRSGEAYEVSDLGRVRNSRGRIVKPFVDDDQNYLRVHIYDNGLRRKAMVHTLVAEAFIGPKREGMEIDHLNTNIHDNRVCNLKYVTREENRRNPVTKFNREVSRIRRAIESGKKSQEDIMRLVAVMKAII